MVGVSEPLRSMSSEGSPCASVSEELAWPWPLMLPGLLGTASSAHVPPSARTGDPGVFVVVLGVIILKLGIHG